MTEAWENVWRAMRSIDGPMKYPGEDMTEENNDTALTIRDDVSVMRPSGEMAVAFEEYQKLQSKLDAAMPDCIIQVGTKKFRTKKYWMAVATAFGVDANLVEPPRRETTPDGDWGYIAQARAVAPNGRTMDAMGACFSGEKPAAQATVHNILSHAETRARLRAISNLVGFGEVSAEEINEKGSYVPPPAKSKPRTSKPKSSTGGMPEWLDYKMIGKKYKDEKWQHMIEGSIGGDRHSYLEYMEGWLADKIAKEPQSKYAAKNAEDLERVKWCLAYIGKRADSSVADGDSWEDYGGEQF